VINGETESSSITSCSVAPSKNYDMTYKILTALNINVRVYWDVTPYSLADMYQFSEQPTASIFRVEEKL
jgi:hypothetical protein